MSRVPLSVAAEILRIRPRTLRQWVRDGRLTRHQDGFDLAELVTAEAARNLDALLSRAGIKFQDRPRDTPAA